MPALTYVYGALIGIGGIFGYAGRGSKASLGWGLLFGTTLCWAALRMKERGPGVRGYPFAVALVCSFLVFLLSTIRILKTGKLWPLGLLSILSVGMSVRYAAHFTIYNDLYEYGI
mmetsp:Transcript_49633/g.121155  ORF Transcript_49633/g.121155 Transcript_49633/m.121155 type:complete len:115 (-) Transcript_49633:67-411(-)